MDGVYADGGWDDPNDVVFVFTQICAVPFPCEITLVLRGGICFLLLAQVG